MIEESTDVPGVLKGPLGGIEAAEDPPPDHARDAASMPAAFGPYRVVEALPAGGMGMVFRAERSDGVFDKTVAVKVMHPGRTDAYALRLFHEERKILAALEHPHIVRILDGGDFGPKSPYFIMEYVDGLRIDQYCRQRQLKVRGRVELIRQVADAVHYLHAKGVIHGDLKPSNILVSRDGTPKVLDFGIARFFRRAGEEGTGGVDTQPLGVSMAYASPETLRMDPVTPASDIYSLGVILFELLTGSRPAVVSWAEPAAPSKAGGSWKELPGGGPAALARSPREELDRIVLRTIEFRAEDRYASAAALASDLRRHLAGEAVEAMGRDWFYLSRKHLARRQFASMLAGTTLALSGVAFWAFRGKAEAEKQLQEAIQQMDAKVREATARESLRQMTKPADAGQEASHSEERARDVRVVSELLSQRIRESLLIDPDSRGDRDNLARRVERYFQLLAPAATDARVARELGYGWVTLGDLWGGEGVSLGSPQNAARAWNEAYRLASLWAADPRFAGEVDEVIQALRERNGALGFRPDSERP
jgi:hypothetical protein